MNPVALAAQLARGLRLVSEEPVWPVSKSTIPTSSESRTPKVVPDFPCGACDVPRDGHGFRYAQEVGQHEWRRTEPVFRRYTPEAGL